MTAVYPYELVPDRPTQIGLVALQSDETIERDFRRLVPADVELLVSRVPSAETVSPSSLRAMQNHIGAAAALFPRAADLACVGYGCTSGASQIGAGKVAALVHANTRTARVTDPLTALIAACGALNVRRLALLSPYVESVSEHLRLELENAGIPVAHFGSFAEAEEAKVVRIDPRSIIAAAQSMMASAKADALFLSCTNLRTLDVVAPLEETLGIPVLSSNQVLAWHMLSRLDPASGANGPGRLLAKT